jgi:hypothetical protein
VSEPGQDSIRRVFTEGFSVRDIAEPLVSFDDVTPAPSARETLRRHDFDVAGVRREGRVAGYIEQASLTSGTCGDHARSFEAAEVLPAAASLADVVFGLAEAPRLFVNLLGVVGGIVTRNDLEKPPVRMWLFGMVTLIEMRLSRLIELHCPDDGWHRFLSAARLQKARDLQAERARRGQHVSLLDCVQFSDKGQIVARNEELRKLTRYESRRSLQQVVKELEGLRNNLAHSQEIVASDWKMILQLTENLESVIEGPPGLR